PLSSSESAKPASSAHSKSKQPPSSSKASAKSSSQAKPKEPKKPTAPKLNAAARLLKANDGIPPESAQAGIGLIAAGNACKEIVQSIGHVVSSGAKLTKDLY